MENNQNTAATTVQSDLIEKISRLDGLPVFPATANQILEETRTEDVDIHRLIQLVECEPVICAKVLQMANSPLYGVTRAIATIGHAVVLLGYRAVAQLAISITTREIFDQGEKRLNEISSQIFQQSLACATVARLLASQFDKSDPDEAFLTGVMHDVGKLVLVAADPDTYLAILEKSPDGYCIESEQNWVGTDHAAIGGQCGAKWGFPAEINHTIGEHHLDFSEVDSELSQCIIAGNYYARLWSIGFAEHELPEQNLEIESEFSPEIAVGLHDQCQQQFSAVKEICVS